jgi:formate hydrogenlyase transcriptional activator
MSADAKIISTGEFFPFARPELVAEPEKLLAAYFSSASVGLCILDKDLRYISINNALAEMNGVPAFRHIGKTVREVLGDIAALLEPNLHRVLETGKPIFNFELNAWLPHRSEGGRWIEHYFPIKDSNGIVTRIGVIAMEITEKEKLKASLDQVSGKLRQQVARLEMLLEVGNILAANWQVQQVFPRISARLRRVLRQEYAAFSLHDRDSGVLVRQAEDFPLGKGLTAPVPTSGRNSPGWISLQERVPLIFSREQMQSLRSDIATQLLAEGLQSLCCVPLVRPQGPLGVLTLGSTRQDAFQAEDLSLLQQVAAQLAIAIENHRAASEIEALKRRLTAERKYLEGEIQSQGLFVEIVGESPALRRVLEDVATVAASNATVLVLGETGTGKELIARAIHRMSQRKDLSFIKVNCAAIPTGLLESELFGHEKGAFTGAILQKIGRMELADGGTIFLDEVGEIPLELQPKLLRVLQDHEFERLGSARTIKIDVRLIAATNRDLLRSVAEKEFRSDLFYRLNVFPVHLPPLRERREDIPLLVRYFVRKFAQRFDRHIETVSSEAMRALQEWSWPGNVRELENLIERSVILSEGPALRVPISELRSGERQPNSQAVPAADHTLDTAEREHILRVLRDTGGVLSGPNGAARRLGLKRTTLQSKMQRLGITRRHYSDPIE